MRRSVSNSSIRGGKRIEVRTRARNPSNHSFDHHPISREISLPFCVVHRIEVFAPSDTHSAAPLVHAMCVLGRRCCRLEKQVNPSTGYLLPDFYKMPTPTHTIIGEPRPGIGISTRCLYIPLYQYECCGDFYVTSPVGKPAMAHELVKSTPPPPLKDNR